MKVYMEKSLPKMDEKKSLKLAGFATVREKYLENEIFSRSGKSQGILLVARESQGLQKSYLFCSREEKMYFLMR